MKKLIALVLVFVCAWSLGGCSASGGKKPYRDLEAAEIASAAVHLQPPDKHIPIEDTAELAELLRNVIIYDEDSSYTEYAGQSVMFTLTMADGTRTEIIAYNPFLVIDDVGYKTAYEPCEALSAYANGLLGAEKDSAILENPPQLMVISGEKAEAALLGTYSWQKKGDDGTIVSVESDSAHPLDCRDLLRVFQTAEKTAELSFLKAPDSILSIRCWKDRYWGNPNADSETMTIDGSAITLKPGGYIYEVTARWNAAQGFGGTAHYSFCIKTV